MEASQSALGRILASGTLIATLLAFGVGWVLAGSTLGPVNRITQTAQAIGAEQNFDHRVAYTGPNDELGRLATTFNSMLSALQSAYRRTEQSLQAQRRFVADASHELRTPLTTIRGNLGLLERVPPISPDDQRAVVADMVGETDRLIRLLNALLALARVDAGQAVRSEPVAIQPILEDLCRQAHLLDADKTIRCEATANVAVMANDDNVRQILLILLDNALKFTPAGGTITLSASTTYNQVELSVRDTGVGIEPAAALHIFERFYRADTSRTGGGAGLGLSIAKSLVEAHHGTIRVESQPGRGSVFTVTLPRADLLAHETD
jgi:signal transduction histidine kinase